MPQVLSELHVRPIERSEESRYRAEMARHHYLGDLNKIGEAIWYIAIWQDQWVAQLSMSAAALKCGARDRWIGWDFRTQYDRLSLIAKIQRGVAGASADYQSRTLDYREHALYHRLELR